jgi:bacteriorhodopsin|tara:strand:+ start:1275 stop:1961 length:687 start_codon:yes stop_codon:yes gene_type:complete
MINNKLVANTIYISLIAQLITTIISLDGLNYELSINDNILRHILILEAFVQFIEAGFYIWVIYSLKDLNIMTRRRYIDWFITTPTMLISTIIFMEYIRKKEANENILEFWDFLETERDNIIKLVLYNFAMLFFGLMGEMGIINNYVAVSIGTAFFALSFQLIYDKYARWSDDSMLLFIFLFSVWSLYGLAALLDVTSKNTMYNILDIISKNFYGLFIYVYIRKVGLRS